MRRISLYVLTALAAAGCGYGIFQYVINPRLSTGPVQLVATSTAAEQSRTPTVLPDVAMPDRNGQMRSITSWTGKSMIVNFWATWCAPCRREIPLLNEIQQQHAAQGFQVVGVAVDVRDEVLEYADANPIRYPLLIGEEGGLEAATKLDQASLALPFTAFTDQQHRIVSTHKGELTKAQADVLLGVITKLNRGELTLKAARAMAAEQLRSLEG